MGAGNKLEMKHQRATGQQQEQQVQPEKCFGDIRYESIVSAECCDHYIPFFSALQCFNLELHLMCEKEHAL